ncbi:MAG: GxxExxY protein [Deltaproteobacteria bacterium]|nr:GxxExxY protein [Deltaproteobacteria bacterium]
MTGSTGFTGFLNIFYPDNPVDPVQKWKFLYYELKAIEKITDAHRAQTLNYLKATGLRLAILLNFGKQKLEYERFVK